MLKKMLPHKFHWSVLHVYIVMLVLMLCFYMFLWAGCNDDRKRILKLESRYIKSGHGFMLQKTKVVQYKKALLKFKRSPSFCLYSKLHSFSRLLSGWISKAERINVSNVDVQVKNHLGVMVTQYRVHAFGSIIDLYQWLLDRRVLQMHFSLISVSFRQVAHGVEMSAVFLRGEHD